MVLDTCTLRIVIHIHYVLTDLCSLVQLIIWFVFGFSIVTPLLLIFPCYILFKNFPPSRVLMFTASYVCIWQMCGSNCLMLRFPIRDVRKMCSYAFCLSDCGSQWGNTGKKIQWNKKKIKGASYEQSSLFFKKVGQFWGDAWVA